MMKIRQLTRHFPHYFPLIGLLVAATIGFVWFWYDRYFLLVIAIATALAYVLWGVIHHAIHRDLYLAVVIEYLAVAILGLVIVFSLIAR